MMYSTLALVLKLVAVALVVSIHPTYSAMTRVPIGLQQLARRSDLRTAPSQAQCWPTTLEPNNSEYEKRCGEKSDSKHPCLTHWRGDLKRIQAQDYLHPRDVKDILFVKDDNMLDFTMNNPKDAFKITYFMDGATVQLIYSDYEEATGCYQIKLRGSENGKWRIWVSDDQGNDRDIDTEHHPETSGKLCTKWSHVHVKHDGPGY
ncbi:related to Mig1-Mig1 protein, induced during biotrophic phase [Sporisorium reilianum f. sp. reilianum]|uniref:Related to Mig1-Mig1 protein, induced during biotrophic phase n=1 Tax=Sporisorium reilianum f. sp. reilianum TaxID=72559 RepID=A0A2N8UGD3_9BASI|nr:related to Mig1-Mig1 protein, induced during biotrophic phase [Sporisorium reilianum f. sp. reilianum]